MINLRTRLLSCLVTLTVLGFGCSTHADLALPATAQVMGTEVKIPVTLSSSETTGDSWRLEKTNAGGMNVVVLKDAQPVYRFEVGKQLHVNPNGVLYSISGTITLGNQSYQVNELFLNSDQSSGYVMLSES